MNYPSIRPYYIIKKENDFYNECRKKLQGKIFYLYNNGIGDMLHLINPCGCERGGFKSWVYYEEQIILLDTPKKRKKYMKLVEKESAK